MRFETTFGFETNILERTSNDQNQDQFIPSSSYEYLRKKHHPRQPHPHHELLLLSPSEQQGVDLQSDSKTKQQGDFRSSSNGISFSRNVDILTNDLNHVKFNFDQGHCDSTDDYGDNNCHYSWGETMNLNLHIDLQQPFTMNDTIHASLTVDYFVSWEVDCKICGEDCIMTVPVVKYDIHIPMPDCPMGTDDIPTMLELPVGDTSPFEGIPLHIQGDLIIKRNEDVEIAKSHIVVDVK